MFHAACTWQWETIKPVHNYRFGTAVETVYVQGRLIDRYTGLFQGSVVEYLLRKDFTAGLAFLLSSGISFDRHAKTGRDYWGRVSVLASMRQTFTAATWALTCLSKNAGASRGTW